MNRAASGQSAIQLSAKGMTGSYTWINTTNGTVNPTLNFKANTNQTIKIQNPTDTKHQLIIDQNGIWSQIGRTYNLKKPLQFDFLCSCPM
ncbi:MAG TPA: hypothetical protein VEP90_25635 [Methylomirabilota bacterium]|nr:hypothetical protein [Methylomirabilota bacterium]